MWLLGKELGGATLAAWGTGAPPLATGSKQVLMKVFGREMAYHELSKTGDACIEKSPKTSSPIYLTGRW